MPRKRARPVREGVVGKGAPTQSHLAGDLLHRTAGSGSGPGKRAGRKPAPRPGPTSDARGSRIERWGCGRHAQTRRSRSGASADPAASDLGGLINEYEAAA